MVGRNNLRERERESTVGSFFGEDAQQVLKLRFEPLQEIAQLTTKVPVFFFENVDF